ncbi:MAG: glucose/galactose MFS transporter [Marinilabilia sp.]
MTKKNLWVPISIIGLMFFVIGFGLGINGYLIPYLKQGLELSSAESYLVLTATFSAFVIFGYPSGLIIKRIGYQRSMVLSFVFFAVGLFLFVPSARYESLGLFLLGSFLSGMGNTLLQASVNPYITIIGPKESAAMRMSIMGIINKGAWAIAPLFLSLFMDLQDVRLSDIDLPFYLIVGIFILLAIFMNFAPLPKVKAEGEDDKEGEGDDDPNAIKVGSEYARYKTKIIQFPHLILGVVTLFFYVGVETIALATIIDYAESLELPNPEVYTSYTVVAMVIGYLIGIFFIPRIMSQDFAFKICTWLGLFSSLVIVLTPIHMELFNTPVSIIFVAILGLANSLMWPAIWPLAIADLGRFTKVGASLLVMGIVGGAVLPTVFGAVKDAVGIQSAYWICFPAYLFILYYAFAGHKIRVYPEKKQVK